MKVVLNSQNIDLINAFINLQKTDYNSVEFINAKVEKILFDNVVIGNVDAYILENSNTYIQKAVDLIKKRYSYIPVIIIGEKLSYISNADIYIPYSYTSDNYKNLIVSIIKNILVYKNNFKKLYNLMTPISDIIEFGECKYDPTRRAFFYKDNLIKKLTAKQGGIIEVLSSNFGEVVKKEIILDKIWKKTDYFSSRSMDVYLTHLRKMLAENNIDITIKNISGIGLILE